MILKQYESHIWGVVASIVTMLLLFLLLWFVYFDRPHVDEEEGIEVVYGDELEAGNDMQEPVGAPVEAVPAPPATVPPTPAAPSNNDLMVQEHEQSLALQKQAEEKRKKQQAEAEELRRKQQEEARIKAEREAAEAAAAAKKAEEDAKRQKAAGAMAGLFGGGSGSGSGSGTTSGDSKQGNPVGKGSGLIGGNQWSLSGRDAKSLPKPNNSFNQEGTVQVSITVDASGKVVSAKAIGGTVSDATTRKLAEEAAMKAVFTAGSSEVRGTITYNFKFN